MDPFAAILARDENLAVRYAAARARRDGRTVLYHLRKMVERPNREDRRLGLDRLATEALSQLQNNLPA